MERRFVRVTNGHEGDLNQALEKFDSDGWDLEVVSVVAGDVLLLFRRAKPAEQPTEAS